MTDDDEEGCEHNWKFTADWEGDDTIPNGTRDCSNWYCGQCDTTTYEQPDGWEPPFDEPYDPE
jgi:hypothetical protein